MTDRLETMWTEVLFAQSMGGQLRQSMNTNQIVTADEQLTLIQKSLLKIRAILVTLKESDTEEMLLELEKCFLGLKS